MIEEIRDIESKGIDPSTIVISDRAHVVMPYHAEFDRLEEERRGDNAIGTTNKGIGPAYKDKVERSGIRIGELLDIDHGTYPYVTSSNPTIGGPMTGMGLGPNAFGGVAGVFKAYCTRVGAGPFPTELKEGIGPQIKEIASEFGVTTGRERRVGWFDGVAGRYSARVNGFDSVIITRLDILDNFDSINVCVAYELNGERIEKFPVDAEQLERCKPIYETLEGWSGTTAGVTDADDLPPEARAYVAFLESVLEVSAAIISTGPRRDETITIKPVIPV
jgi:adenylosuccinate synthase